MSHIKGPGDKQVEAHKKALAHRMKAIRDERGLQRAWVADQLGVSYDTLMSWELGTSRPGTIEHLLHLATIYDIEPNEFAST